MIKDEETKSYEYEQIKEELNRVASRESTDVYTLLAYLEGRFANSKYIPVSLIGYVSGLCRGDKEVEIIR